MARIQITAAGDESALVLPQAVLDQLGVNVGDEVVLSVVDGTLILRPLAEVERARQLETTTEAVFERRRSAYEELAKGDG